MSKQLIEQVNEQRSFGSNNKKNNNNNSSRDAAHSHLQVLEANSMEGGVELEVRAEQLSSGGLAGKQVPLFFF